MTRAQVVVPLLRYRDFDDSLQWLCQAFGFEIGHRELETSGEVRYVSLGLGGSQFLACPVCDSNFDKLMVQPEDVAGANTQSCYLCVDDIDGHYRRTRAAGAKIEFEPQADEEGELFYVCRDPEGHLWTFGTGSYGTDSVLPVPTLRIDTDALVADKQPKANAVATPPTSKYTVAFASIAALVVGSLAAYGAFRLAPPVSTAAQTVPIEKVLANLASERDKRTTAESAATAAAAKIARQQTAIADLTSEVQSLNRQVARLDLAKAEASDTLNSSNNRIADLQLRYRQAVELLDEARSRAAALEKAEPQTLAVLQAQRDIAKADKLAIDELTAEAQSARKALNDVGRDLSEERTHSANQERGLRDLNQRLADALEIRIQLERRIGYLLRDLAAASREKLAALNNADSLRIELSAETEKVRFTSSLIDSGGTALSRAEQKIASLESDLRQRPSPDKAGPVIQIGDVPSPPVTAARSPAAARNVILPSTQTMAALTKPAVKFQAKPQAPAVSGETGKCLEQVMGGKVDWGGGTAWSRQFAVKLCLGANHAQERIGCFNSALASGASWKQAIDQCRS